MKTQTTQLKLKELWSKSQEEVNQEELSFQLETAQLSLQSDILATRQSLAKAESKLKNTYLQKPFNASNIIAAKQEVNELTKGLEALKELEKLF